MPRKNLIRTSIHPYHVTVRSNNSEWFYVPTHEVWSVFGKYCGILAKEYRVTFHAFVLMSNHAHMLLSTPESNLDSAMNYLLRETSRAINYTAGRQNHVFGGPYRWSLIASPGYYQHAYKYVYRNPVKAKICERVEDYPFSTLYYKLHGLPWYAPISPSVFGDIHSSQTQLKWLNTAYKKNEEECLRKALRRSDFRIGIDRRTRKIPEIFIDDAA